MRFQSHRMQQRVVPSLCSIKKRCRTLSQHAAQAEQQHFHLTATKTTQQCATQQHSTLSLRPSLHSGMPLRKVLIFKAPTTSDRTTVPLLLTSKFTLSTTSKKTSFFLYLIPSLRQETALVTAIGGFTATCGFTQASERHGIDQKGLHWQQSTTKACCTCLSKARNALAFFHVYLHLVCICLDILRQNLCFCKLRIAKVHHLRIKIGSMANEQRQMQCTMS